MKYTVFIREPENRGTTYIDSTEANSPEEAVRLCKENCIEDWEWNEDKQGELHILGIAEGSITILEWDDLI